MRKFTTTLLMLAVAMCVSAANPYKSFTENLPFSMPEFSAPQIPELSVSLADFGADPTATNLSTEAFAKAIEALTEKGGGHLVVPCGVWLTGPIVLKSNIDLHLEKGAVILFAADETL
ncbi:MAG: glycoside hydrolase family 28 protein, partial [Prevotella sp.]|nr:glycoside hydrolase family 28 protein [Prevotella sp.]